MIKLYFFAVILFISFGCEKTSFPPNVLFITVDDLRPDLGGDMVIAPNIKNFKKMQWNLVKHIVIFLFAELQDQVF